MNHGSAFQALWRQLQQEVRCPSKQGVLRGRYNILFFSFVYEALTPHFLHHVLGYWSSGTRLVDSAKTAGQGIEMGELPEYMVMFHYSPNTSILLRLNNPVWWCSFESASCLAAAPQTQGPTDIQEAESRNEIKFERVQLHRKSLERRTWKRKVNRMVLGSGRKRGGWYGFSLRSFRIVMVLCSKRAREERAQAAEQRIQALQGESSSSNLPILSEDMESEDEKRDSETDYDRRRTLLEVIEENDLDALRAADV
ncbi:hypothetical protein J3R82DRAFT_4359 [Butyriboletus roseoflavus]|nr:hypothetical protein J3R82DRAFT_4359 [Butyriboletus roseoflavus]